MNKDTILLELNNLLADMPKSLADEDFSQRYNRFKEVNTLIETTNTELSEVESRLDGEDQTLTQRLLESQADLRNEELSLADAEEELSSYENTLLSFERGIETDERLLSDLENSNQKTLTKEENLGLETLVNSNNPEVSKRANERLAEILKRRREREERIKILKERINANKKHLEEQRSYIKIKEEEIKKQQERVNDLRKKVETFRTDNEERLTVNDTLRKTELENRLIALSQAKRILEVRPEEELREIIGFYQAGEIDEAEVRRRLEPLREVLTITGVYDQARQLESQDISSTREKLEAEIREEEELLNNMGHQMPNTELLEEYSGKKDRFRRKITELDRSDYEAKAEINRNIAQIQVNEEYIKTTSEELAMVEQEISQTSPYKYGEHGRLESINEQRIRELKELRDDLKEDLVHYEYQNNTLNLANEKNKTDMLDRVSIRERYNSSLNSMDSIVVNKMNNVSNIRLLQTSINDKKRGLASLTLREEYLKESITDRFDDLLNKLPKSQDSTQNRFNNASQLMEYQRILAGLPLEERAKAEELAPEYAGPMPPGFTYDNNVPLLPEKSSAEILPVPIKEVKTATPSLLDKIKNHLQKHWKRWAAGIATVIALATILKSCYKDTPVKEIVDKPGIVQEIEREEEKQDEVLKDLPSSTKPTPTQNKPSTPQPEKPATPDKPVTPETPIIPDKPVTPEVPETPTMPTEGYNVTPDETITSKESIEQSKFPVSESVQIVVDGVKGYVDMTGTAYMYDNAGNLIKIQNIANIKQNNNGTFNITDINYDKIASELDRAQEVTTPLPPTGEEITEKEAQEQVENNQMSEEQKSEADKAAEEAFENYWELVYGNGETEVIKGPGR